MQPKQQYFLTDPQKAPGPRVCCICSWQCMAVTQLPMLMCSWAEMDCNNSTRSKPRTHGLRLSWHVHLVFAFTNRWGTACVGAGCSQALQ